MGASKTTQIMKLLYSKMDFILMDCGSDSDAPSGRNKPRRIASATSQLYL